MCLTNTQSIQDTMISSKPVTNNTIQLLGHQQNMCLWAFASWTVFAHRVEQVAASYFRTRHNSHIYLIMSPIADANTSARNRTNYILHGFLSTTIVVVTAAYWHRAGVICAERTRAYHMPIPLFSQRIEWELLLFGYCCGSSSGGCVRAS